MNNDAGTHRHGGDRRRLRGVIAYLAMLVVVATVVIPLYFVLITSLKPRPDIYTQPVMWFPDEIIPDSYTTVFTAVPFWEYLRNSVFITAVLTVVQVVLGVLSAYALVFLRFPGRHAAFLFILASLMVPKEITVISNFALVAQLGWTNSFAGIIVPLAGVAFGAYLLRNHFMSLPGEVIEAARMDGTPPMKMLWRVVLPMSWPTVAAFTIITIVTEWNQYLWPFLIASNEKVAPLPVGLTLLQQAEGLTNWGPVMAGTVVTMLPILVAFLLLQKQMIKGLTAGAVKG